MIQNPCYAIFFSRFTAQGEEIMHLLEPQGIILNPPSVINSLRPHSNQGNNFCRPMGHPEAKDQEIKL